MRKTSYNRQVWIQKSLIAKTTSLNRKNTKSILVLTSFLYDKFLYAKHIIKIQE